MNSEQHDELRDIHKRIDALKDESERQYQAVTDKQERHYKDLTDKLHSLEVAIARGNRFPPGAWVAAAAILVTMIGGFSSLYSKLESAGSTSSKALNLIERHVEGSSGRWQSIEENSAFVHEWSKKLPMLEDRTKSLEGRIVGIGPNGWHRSDHDNYANAVEAQLKLINRRIDDLENRKNR